MGQITTEKLLSMTPRDVAHAIVAHWENGKSLKHYSSTTIEAWIETLLFDYLNVHFSWPSLHERVNENQRQIDDMNKKILNLYDALRDAKALLTEVQNKL